jgi:anthranilate phosphoribosyltransferase
MNYLWSSDIAECVEKAGITFMSAPLFHPAVGHVVPVRKALGK